MVKYHEMHTNPKLFFFQMDGNETQLFLKTWWNHLYIQEVSLGADVMV